MKRTICEDDATCVVLREASAGVDALGNALFIVSVTGGPDSDGMEYRAHWLIGRQHDEIVLRQHVATEWVDKDVPLEDTATVTPNAFETKIIRWPTSSWQSFPARTFQLAPLMLVEQNSVPQHIGDEAGIFGSVELSLRDGSGRANFFCGPVPGRRGDYLPIPSTKRRKGFDPATGLGRCAVEVDGRKNHGWQIRGARKPASGSMRIADIGVLFVEVHDDRWAAGDKLEIRTGRRAGFMECDGAGDALTMPSTYTIDGDGTVHASPKTAPPLAVTKVRDDMHVRTFRIGGELTGISVAQIDDDGDGTMPTTVATTPIGTSIELGSYEYISDVACEATLDGPALVPDFATE